MLIARVSQDLLKEFYISTSIFLSERDQRFSDHQNTDVLL